MSINVYGYKIEAPDETIVAIYVLIPDHHPPTPKTPQKLLQKYSLCH